MTILRPRAEERFTLNGRTFSDAWLRTLWGVIDAVTGAAPPRVPTVYINPTGAQRGLPAASDGDGQLVLVADESGGPVLAFSVGGSWRRVTDRAVIS